jgi:predicted nucleic acid-binding protein
VIAVVADTAPLRYLVQIDFQQILPLLFTRVLIPTSVWRELQHERTPLPVRQWAANLPEWIEIRQLESVPNPALAELHEGERDAIQLAFDLGIKLLLIDERAGAHVAREQGFFVTGTVGILLGAAELGYISLEDALTRLAATNFRRTTGFFDQVRDVARKRGLATERKGAG